MAKKAILKGSGVDKIIAKHYYENRGKKGIEILHLVNKDPALNGRHISLSYVQAILAKFHKQEKELMAAGILENPLDRPWNIGLSMKYRIPDDMLPILIKAQKNYPPTNGVFKNVLTIRTAIWLSYLYPTLAERIGTRLREEINLQIIVIIAEQYAAQESIHEIVTGELSPFLTAPDTSELDAKYFEKNDYSLDSLLRGFIQGQHPELEKETVEDLLKEFDSGQLSNKWEQDPKAANVFKVVAEYVHQVGRKIMPIVPKTEDQEQKFVAQIKKLAEAAEATQQGKYDEWAANNPNYSHMKDSEVKKFAQNISDLINEKKLTEVISDLMTEKEEGG